MIKVNRRQFLKGSVAIGVAGALSGTVLNSLRPSKADAAETGTMGWTPSTCVGCTTWCPIDVRTQEIGGIKRAIDIRENTYGRRGNPNNDGSNGPLSIVCPKARMALQEAYDADRVKVPMRRSNPIKGRGVDPGFVPISWQDAMDEIAQKMVDMRNNGNSHKWAWLRGRYTYNRTLTYDAVKAIYGSPNGISHSAICAESENFARSVATGRWGYDDYDLNNCRYLILWGVDPVSSNRLNAGTIARFGNLAATGMTVVSVDPRLHTSGAKAHKWLPVNPGTDGALALALAHHILVTGLWNKAFVGLDDTVFTAGADAVVGAVPEKGTMGLVTWWNKVLKNCTPSWAAGITGISPSTIRSVAEGFAGGTGNDKGKAISWVGPGITMQPNGAYAGWAAIALNGLVGSFDHVGGEIQAEGSNKAYTDSTPSVSAYKDSIATTGTNKEKLIHYVQKSTYDHNSIKMPAITYDTSSKIYKYQGTSPTSRLAECIVDKSPYETKMLIGAMANFAFSCCGANLFEQALSGDMTDWSASASDNAPPFYVDIATHVSETGMLADIILPASHVGLEAKGSTHQRSGMYKTHSLFNPVISPVWPEAKNAELEFPWLLGQALDDWGFSNLLDFMRTEYPLAYDSSSALAKTDDSSVFEDVAWKYHATGNPADVYGNSRTDQWTAITSPTFTTISGSSTLYAGNGMTQATYASTYFDVDGRGEAWRDAILASPTGKFKTKSGKVEFHNPTSAFKSILDSIASNHGKTVPDVLNACNYDKIATDAAIDLAMANMPNYEDPYINSGPGYTLTLIDYKSRLNREGRSANAPWYHEFKSCDAGDEKWKDVIKINPLDAITAGVSDGDTVIVSSPSNPTGIECTVKVWQGVRKGTAAKAYGQGHWAYGRYASKVFGSTPGGGNNNEILKGEFDRLIGSAARNANTKVKIVKKP